MTDKIVDEVRMLVKVQRDHGEEAKAEQLERLIAQHLAGDELATASLELMVKASVVGGKIEQKRMEREQREKERYARGWRREPSPLERRTSKWQAEQHRLEMEWKEQNEPTRA